VVTALSGLAEEILRYLQTHPNASDTLLGITEWWLLKQRIEIAANEVQKALDQLVLREFLLKTGSHGSTSFRLNRRKLAQIRSLLANATKDQHNKPNHPKLGVRSTSTHLVL
jgi:hypothetical protein